MFCSTCGAPLEGAKSCANCNKEALVTASEPMAKPVKESKPNVLAIIGLIVAIVGGASFSWIGAILGIIALIQIRKKEGREGGKGLAIAAIVISVLVTVISIVAALAFLFGLGITLLPTYN